MTQLLPLLTLLVSMFVAFGDFTVTAVDFIVFADFVVAVVIAAVVVFVDFVVAVVIAVVVNGCC